MSAAGVKGRPPGGFWLMIFHGSPAKSKNLLFFEKKEALSFYFLKITGL
jgi:hypothetical protein